MTEKHYHPPQLVDEIEEYREEPMIRVVMMPKHTNALGSIFGGVILSHLDIAAGEEAFKTAGKPCVTKVMNQVDFAAPVEVGDWVSFYTRTEGIGETSVTVRVLVVAHRGFERSEVYRVTEAEVIYVAVDEDGNPTEVRS